MRLPTRLLRRRPESDKSDYGHIFILAGSARYSGAALLCAEGALRSGAGLVTLGIPEGLNNAIIRTKPREVITLPLPETAAGSLSIKAYAKIKNFCSKHKVLAIGPGLGDERTTWSLARKLIRALNQPMVIDADALNALAGHLEILRSQKTKGRSQILTPHPGEMSRLSGLNVEKIQKNRIVIADKFARRYKLTLVLKGRHTVVCDYQGNTYINKTGNPGMSSAGSGDVLTGMIAAFLGQGLNAFNSAKYGVYLHGLAGDLAAKEKTQISLIASDIIAKIPEAIKKSS